MRFHQFLNVPHIIIAACWKFTDCLLYGVNEAACGSCDLSLSIWALRREKANGVFAHVLIHAIDAALQDIEK